MLRMRREGLRRQLALAICELLIGHKKTVPNVQRYVVPFLSHYRIRKDQVRQQDIFVALEFVQNARRQKPIQFMRSDKSLWVTERRTFFLEASIESLTSTD